MNEYTHLHMHMYMHINYIYMSIPTAMLSWQGHWI